MKNIKVLSALAIFIMIFASCASTQKKMLLSGQVPQFKGCFSPISISIQPCYKPVSLKYFTSFNVYMQISELSEQKEEYIDGYFGGFIQVSEVGEHLLWKYDITSMDVGNKKWDLTIPIARCKWSSDNLGTVKEFDISSPAIEAGILIFKGGQQEYDEFLKTTRKDFEKYISQVGYILSNNPVKTGDSLWEYNLYYFIDKFLSNLKIPAQEKDKIIRQFSEQSFKHIIKGKCQYEGREVILTNVDGTHYFNEILHFDSGKMSVTGYNLIDMETFQALFGEVLMVVKLESKIFETITVKMLGSYHAKIL